VLKRWQLLIVLVLTGVAVAARQSPPARPDTRFTLFDEISDPVEQGAFRTLWNTPEPSARMNLVARFVTDYPRSALLKEAYEFGAHAAAALGDRQSAIAWAQRALRITPENPFLLALLADMAVNEKRLELAETSAKEAVRLVENAESPIQISATEWPRARDELRANAFFVLGRAALARNHSDQAEALLKTVVTLNPQDTDALSLLGSVELATGHDAEASKVFGEVVRRGGPLESGARQSLMTIYRRLPSRPQSFEDYLRALVWVPPTANTPPAPATMTRAYAGSQECRPCHAREYDSWRATGMAKMLRPYTREDLIGDFSGEIVDGRVRPLIENGKPFIDIRAIAGDAWTRYSVDYLIGSKWQQAYATRLDNGDFLVLPMQYSRVRARWVNYWEIVDVVGSGRSEFTGAKGVPDGALYQTDCAPCHTSQLRKQTASAVKASALFHEGGINCEMCHGPSKDHVDAKRRNQELHKAPLDPPVRFSGLTASQSVAICAQCHMQSAVHDAQSSGAVNFSELEGPFYRSYRTHLLSDFSRRAFYRDGRFNATTFIGEAFVRSRCYRDGNATCASCHDPHPLDAVANPTSLKFGEDSDRMCTQCHRELADHPERHTRHTPGSDASRCVSCHMPRIVDALLFPARSHEIDQIPDAGTALRFGQKDSPNACLSCHTERSVSWLQTELARWR